MAVKVARLRRVRFLECLQLAPKVLGHMPHIVRRLSIARHVLPQVHTTVEHPLQDVHLVKEEDDSRTREERVRADLLPEGDGVLEAVDRGRLGEGLCEEERCEENDRGDVVEVWHPFISLRDRGKTAVRIRATGKNTRTYVPPASADVVNDPVARGIDDGGVRLHFEVVFLDSKSP